MLVSAYSLVANTGLLASKDTQAADLDNLFSSDFVTEDLNYSFALDDINLSDKINLEIPIIAENGAVVPLSVTSTLENVAQIYLFVEKNPTPLVALFNLSPVVEAFVSARIKMAETSKVIVVVKTESGLYKTQKQVKVTLGGCGG